MTVSDYSILSGVEPYKPLLKKISDRAGRNSAGRITTRHQGGGNKKIYRIIDFKLTDKIDIPAKVTSIEYDPYRTAYIALLLFKDGDHRYIVAQKDLKVNDEIIVSKMAPFVIGNRMPLVSIPVGYEVSNIELQPMRGGQMARSAGSYAQILAHEQGYTNLKLASGEIRRVLSNCFASIGQMSNSGHNLITIGKAGRSRWLGIRPTVRGSAMNPVDHPYGGGEGRQRRGTKRPKTKWGKVTGGRKTRKKFLRSQKLILQRRKK